MAKASIEIISLLRQTARAITVSKEYQWGHMGACNCGFLAQQVTHLKKSEIHSRAMQGSGDWNEQLNDYCPTSGLPMDSLIRELVTVGFDVDDLKHLEKLSSAEVLRWLAVEDRNVRHNNKTDVVKYLNAWALLLEEKMLSVISLEEIIREREIV